MLVKAEASIPESQVIFQEVLSNPGKVFEMMRFDFKSIAEMTLSNLLKEELTHFLALGKTNTISAPSGHLVSTLSQSRCHPTPPAHENSPKISSPS